MYAAAPRLEDQLVRAIVLLDDRDVPMAETYRRLRGLTAQIGVPRPSYERVRVELRASRRRADAHREKRTKARELAIQLAYNTRRADTVFADLLELVDEQSRPSYKL
jgi:hypothetical protein